MGYVGLEILPVLSYPPIDIFVKEIGETLLLGLPSHRSKEK